MRSDTMPGQAFTEADISLLSDIADGYSTVDHYDRLDALRKRMRIVVRGPASADDAELRERLTSALEAGWRELPSSAQDVLASDDDEGPVPWNHRWKNVVQSIIIAAAT